MGTVDVGGRLADELTGRYVDGKEPAYVNESARLLDERVHELEEKAKHPPPELPTRTVRPQRGPLTDEERAWFGLPPRHR